MRTVILVEGNSDRTALLALSRRRGHARDAEGVDIVAMGGITNTHAHLKRYVPTGIRLAGLYDSAEEPQLRAALSRAGVSAETFFGCEPDLEYELIRALGLDAIEAVIEAEGELKSLQLLTGMPPRPTGPGWRHRFTRWRTASPAPDGGF